MKSLGLAFLLTIVPVLVGPGCGARPEDQRGATTPAHPSDPTQTTNGSLAGIGGIREHLQSGDVETAAAALALVQLEAEGFDSLQAREYRDAYTEVYDRAIEAVQRGDPQGEMALQLLRLGGPR
jgi:hypothetical protein